MWWVSSCGRAKRFPLPPQKEDLMVGESRGGEEEEGIDMAGKRELF